MRRVQIKSSVIVSLGYDEGAQVLEVEFVGGRVYRYAPVPRREFEDLMAAESKGLYFNLHVRDHYVFAEVN